MLGADSIQSRCFICEVHDMDIIFIVILFYSYRIAANPIILFRTCGLRKVRITHSPPFDGAHSISLLNFEYFFYFFFIIIHTKCTCLSVLFYLDSTQTKSQLLVHSNFIYVSSSFHSSCMYR